MGQPLDCLDAKFLVEQVLSDGRGFDDAEEQDEYQRAADHIRLCRCGTCEPVRIRLDGDGIPVSIGQAS